jgi:hypothetical protein
MESATLTRPRSGPDWLARLRAAPPSAWAIAGFAVLCVASAVGFLVYQTFPTYDSYYALLWGRDVVHLHAPVFHVYRAPTEHPLAIAFGGLLSIFGRGADRLMVAATVASFVALVAGVFRLTRIVFTPLVAWIAAGLLCTRFEFAFLAARGYLDIPYLALIVWAAVLEAERTRRGTPVFIVLAGAGLLRPEAWLITGLYFLWCAWTARGAQVLRYALLTAIGPVVWAGIDLAVTGDPLYSLHSTSGLADELGRASGLSSVPSAMAQFLLRLDHAPVLIGAGAGIVLAIVLTPRRALIPLFLLLTGVGTFVMVGFAGLSVIDRYLLAAALMMMVFAAVGLGGWTMLSPGWLRRAWALGAAVLLVYGIATTVGKLSFTSFQTELAFRRDSHAALERILAEPSVRAGERCGPISVPNHSLIPEVRWLLGRGPETVLARSQARVLAARGDYALRQRISRGVALYPTGTAVFRQAIVESSDNPLDQLPLSGFNRVATSQYYAAYVRC